MQRPLEAALAVDTGAAERQDPVFLIGPRNKKTRKKRPTIKILYPQRPVHVSASSRSTPAVFAVPIDQKTRLWAWDALPRRLIEIICGHHHQKPWLVIWTGG
jgi:hypothetical protein